MSEWSGEEGHKGEKIPLTVEEAGVEDLYEYAKKYFWGVLRETLQSMANLRDVIVTDEAWEFLDQIFNGENGILWENELKVRKAFDEKEMDMGNAWDKDVLDSGATSLANLIIIRAIYEGKIDPSRKRVLRRGDVWLGWYDFGETRPTDCIWPWPCP